MVLFFILLLLGLSLVAVTLILHFKKVHLPSFTKNMMGIIGLFLIIYPSISVIAHAANNQKVYEAALRNKAELEQRQDDYLDAIDEEKESKENLLKDIYHHNVELEAMKEKRSSVFTSWFSYDFAINSFDELYVTVRIPE